MFYDAKKKKVIWIGSSQVGNHSILANIHVEEIAIDKIKKHIKQNNLNYKYVKNFKIILFKVKRNKSNDGLNICSAFCCNWCSKLMFKNNIPVNNVINKNIIRNDKLF